jgi:hypothetical protein
MAATLAFFWSNLFTVCAIYPALIDAETFGEDDVETLRDSRNWLWAGFVVAVMTPLAASLALSALGSTLRPAFAALGVVGLVNLAMSLGLLPGLQRSLTWLTAVADPAAAAESHLSAK